MNRPARVHISLAHLRHNFDQVRRLAPDSRIMAVIKADAYGHGAVACARALTDQADAFAVATFGEACILQDAGLTNELVVLHGGSSQEELKHCLERHLTLVVHDRQQIDCLEQAGVDATAPLPWLKVNTGMNRLGVALEEAQACQTRLRTLLGRPPRLMTHLACADQREDPMTRKQLEQFASLAGDTERSAANSAAILGDPQSHLDWVRPGLMLYGVSPIAAPQISLRPVMRLEAPLLARFRCRAGSTIGYGATFTCDTDREVGIVEIGYADGYPRGSRAQASVHGIPCRLLGRVSMDLTAIDLSGTAASPKDPVELWGEHMPVEQVARECDTIAYELLCRVGHLPHSYRD